jgi:hypothetical protein
MSTPAAAVQVIDVDESTFLEVVQLAAKANVAVVERGGRCAFCGVENIPAGWHRVGYSVKGATA